MTGWGPDITDDELIALANAHPQVAGWAILHVDATQELTIETHKNYDNAVYARRHYPFDDDGRDGEDDFTKTLIVATFTRYSDEEDQ